jgi:hypothetical protein
LGHRRALGKYHTKEVGKKEIYISHSRRSARACVCGLIKSDKALYLLTHIHPNASAEKNKSGCEREVGWLLSY